MYAPHPPPRARLLNGLRPPPSSPTHLPVIRESNLSRGRPHSFGRKDEDCGTHRGVRPCPLLDRAGISCITSTARERGSIPSRCVCWPAYDAFKSPSPHSPGPLFSPCLVVKKLTLTSPCFVLFRKRHPTVPPPSQPTRPASALTTSSPSSAWRARSASTCSPRSTPSPSCKHQRRKREIQKIRQSLRGAVLWDEDLA